VTSHLGALKLGWASKKGITNGSLEFDKQSGPTYRFIMGVPGQSLAIQTAKRVGVATNIVQRALNYLSPELRQYQSSLEDIEKMKNEVLKLQDLLNSEIKKAAAEKSKYTKMVAQFEAEKENRLDKEVRQAAKKIDDLIQESKVKDVFRKHEDLQKIKYELPKIIKQSDKESSTQTSQRLQILSAEDFAKAFPPGSAVHISSLGRDGIVQGVPNSKGEVPVLSNSMRLLLLWHDLKPAVQSQNPTQNILRKTGRFAYSPADSDRVVDLRGLTSEDAISQLEIQLDAASLGSEDRIKVIHGHGTDALKRSIRSYLSRSVYVKKWAAGNADTGGDGVTWVELK
jgi:DNA mismatch repair protein MutS2